MNDVGIGCLIGNKENAHREQNTNTSENYLCGREYLQISAKRFNLYMSTEWNIQVQLLPQALQRMSRGH